MWYGAIEFDLLLGAVASRKEKRSVVRPLIAEIRRRFDVSVAEVGHLDLQRRTLIGVVVTAGDGGRVNNILDQIERMVAGRFEVELITARRRTHKLDDE